MNTFPEIVAGTLATTEDSLLAAIAPLQLRLADHPFYRSVRSLPALQLFMESHVYAVWDFMSLLKASQRELTCVEVPWRPTADAASRRLINEIVLREESDLYQGAAISHFELYLQAMQSCGAGTVGMESLLAALRKDATLESALSFLPAESADFVRSTFAILATGETHRIAAAFAFGREDLIPDMFTAFVRELDEQTAGPVALFRYYLERHIEVDGDEHGPMAMEMMRQLCPTERHWEEATDTACTTLEARLALWDGIHARIAGAASNIL